MKPLPFPLEGYFRIAHIQGMYVVEYYNANKEFDFTGGVYKTHSEACEEIANLIN